MPILTVPTFRPLGSVLLGTPLPPPTTWVQDGADATALFVIHRPVKALGAAVRPTLPRPISTRLRLNGSSTRSVTEGNAVPAGTVPALPARCMTSGLRM